MCELIYMFKQIGHLFSVTFIYKTGELVEGSPVQILHMSIFSVNDYRNLLVKEGIKVLGEISPNGEMV